MKNVPILYKKITFGLFLGAFISFCNLYLFQPLLPLIVDSYQVPETQANWVLASSTFTLALSLIPWAIVSEMVGRRKILLISLYLSPLLGVGALWAESLSVLIFLRALMGIVLGGFVAIAVAYMVEELPTKIFAIAIGSYISANSLGGITGRLFGGLIGEYWGWQSAAFAMGILSLVVAIVVHICVPPQRKFIRSEQGFMAHCGQIYQHIKNTHLWFAMLIGGLNFALFVNLYSVMGFRLVAEPYNLPVSFIAFIFLCYLSGTLSSRLSGLWAQRFSSLSGMILGAFVSFCGLLLGNLPFIPTMIIALLLISSGAFFLHSLAYAWVTSHAKVAKATASALYLVHYYVGGSLGGFFLIYCWQHGQWLSVSFGAALLYALILLLVLRLKKLNNFSSD